MKTTIQIIELDKEDLISLFAVALYGSSMFGADYSSSEYKRLAPAIREKDECFEDKLASLLLNDKSIEITDYYAEEEIFGDRANAKVDDDGNVTYTLTYKAMLNSINHLKGEDVLQVIDYFKNPEEKDLYDAQDVLQLILFGEVIYG